jgi:hypothetical protein
VQRRREKQKSTDLEQIVAPGGSHHRGEIDDAGQPDRLGSVAVSSGVIFSTHAAKRCFNLSVSPGTATKVTGDCSPASEAAAFSTASDV